MYAPSNVPGEKGISSALPCRNSAFPSSFNIRVRLSATCHEFFGQIQSCHLTSLLREMARRAAHSTADIQQMHPRPKMHKAGQVLNRLPPAEMEIVQRRNVIATQVRRILPCIPQRSQNLLLQIARGVVCRDLLFNAHVFPFYCVYKTLVQKTLQRLTKIT